MSPEQIRGERLDLRTEVFSFGLVLYEMATGRRAFQGDTGPALHAAILEQTPALAREVHPALPVKLERIISKALEKNREQRYQNVSDMRADLEALKREIVPGNHLRRWVVAAMPVATILIGGAIFWFARHGPTPSLSLPDLKLTQLTDNLPRIR